MKRPLRIIKLGPPTAQDSLVIDPKTMMATHKSGASLVLDSEASAKTGGDKAARTMQEKVYREQVPPDIDEKHYGRKTLVASGGMGMLYSVQERDLDRQVAMKVVIPREDQFEGILNTFMREAKLTARLQHPNIVPVYGLGHEDSLGVYYTMRLVKGETMLQIISKLITEHKAYTNKYDYVELLEIFRKVCSAVAYAHSENIIHRDIKPGNIMVGKFGDVLLLDWGLAREKPKAIRSKIGLDGKMVKEEVTTFTGLLKGTPSYMSPEQAYGSLESIDDRTDVFLLGATLYHMFTHEPPYPGKDIAEVIKNAKEAAYDPPDSNRFESANIPPAVCDVINKAMQPDPDKRYQSVDDLLKDVDDIVHGSFHFKRGTFKKGEIIIRQGEQGDKLYYIQSGRVVVYSEGGFGLVRELERVGPGEIIGELALISDKERQASAKALTDTEVLILDKTAFEDSLGKISPWLSQLIRCLAGRLLTANSLNRDLHLRPSFLPWFGGKKK